MNPILRNILAVVAGLIIGNIVNMSIIQLGMSVVPLPEGIDPTNAESLKENIHLLETKHYIVPLLAHALGTVVGVFVGVRLAAMRHKMIGWILGFIFFAFGILASTMIPAPSWFIATDLLVAYLPMAFLGMKLTRKVE